MDPSPKVSHRAVLIEWVPWYTVAGTESKKVRVAPFFCAAPTSPTAVQYT